MELLQLRYFRTAAQLESITKAAQLHHIPQPDMSKTVSKLESELGCKLFDRAGNRIRLNEKGKEFLAWVDSSLSALDSGIEAVSDTMQSHSEIKLLILEHRNLLTDCIAQFKQEHPEIHFNICHNFYDTRSFNFDLCIAAFPPTDDRLEELPLTKETIKLGVNSCDELSSRKEVSLGELSGRRFISLPPSSSISRIANEVCLSYGFSPEYSIFCDDPYYIRRYISIGLGIAFVPSISWSGMFADNVSLLRIREPGFIRTTRIYWPSDRYISIAARTFRDYVSTFFADKISK